MLAVILYILIGIVSGFCVYWISYKLAKEELIQKMKNRAYSTRAPTHEEVKNKVVAEDLIPVILTIIFWPLTMLVVLPVIGLFMGGCFAFEWVIDRVEGRKYDATKG